MYNAKKDAFSAEKTLWTTSNEHVAGTAGSTGDHGFDYFDFTIGDFDGDGAMDVIFEGRQKEYKNCKVLVLSYDSAKKSYNWKASSGAKRWSCQHLCYSN